MTLQEKFIQVMNYQFYFGVHQSDKIERAAENLEKVAEEFAVGFGEYLDSLTAQDMGILSIKELLEIYKKTL